MQILLVMGIGIACSCKQLRQNKIIGVNEMPVIIKFDIPHFAIVNEQIDSYQENQIRNKVIDKYPALTGISLIHYKILHSVVGYFEYTAKIEDKYVNVFVFSAKNGISINAFYSKHMFQTESRFEINRTGLEIYKKTVGKYPVTVSTLYVPQNRRISFCADDGFSGW